jgi:AraC-like DNA-binding protein
MVSTDSVPDTVLQFAQRCQLVVAEWPHAPLYRFLPRLWACLQSCPRAGEETCVGACQTLARVAHGFPVRVGERRDRFPSTQHSRRVGEDHVYFVLMHLASESGGHGLETSLGHVAQILGWSRFHLSRTMTAVTHVPWSIHVNGFRVLTALQLLAGSDCPVKEIAWQVGYPRTSELDRQFHRWFGFSPLRYRECLEAWTGAVALEDT